MISRIRLLLPLLLAALPMLAHADLPGPHPKYLAALSDLRAARWLISQHASSYRQSRDEDLAVFEIEKAMGEIKRAAIDDGKDLNFHPAVDLPPEPGHRLSRALDLLEKVHSDVARAEEDPYTRGLRDRALLHIDAASQAVVRAMRDHHFDRFH
jgi:hypothetical protein